jgi:hypothetical protein
MRGITVIVGTALVIGPSCRQETPKQQEPPRGEKGVKLWAAVGVSDLILNWNSLDWDLRTRGPFTINFNVMNDGEKVVDPKLKSSRLFINGKECDGKEGRINWLVNMNNGPRDERWKALPPGDYISFTKAMGDYFKEPGEYRIKWKGEGFEAPEVVFRVMPSKKVDK